MMMTTEMLLMSYYFDMSEWLKGGECKIFCVNEKIHTKKEVASVE